MPHRIAVLAFDGISPFHLSVPRLVFGDDIPSLLGDHYAVTTCAESRELSTSAGYRITVPAGLEAFEDAETVVVPSWRVGLRPSAALLDALAALRAERLPAARAHLERAISVLPRRGLSALVLAGAPADEVGWLAALAADHPRGAELRLEHAARFAAASAPAPAVLLSEREREILRLLRDGATNGEMARCLYISVNTVKFHRANLMRKLGARNRAEVLEAATVLGLLRPVGPQRRSKGVEDAIRLLPPA